MFSLLREKFAQRFLHLIRIGRLLRFVVVSVELSRRVLIDRVVVFQQVVNIFFLVRVGRQLGKIIRSSGRRFLEIDKYDALATTPDVFVNVVEAEN